MYAFFLVCPSSTEIDALSLHDALPIFAEEIAFWAIHQIHWIEMRRELLAVDRMNQFEVTVGGVRGNPGHRLQRVERACGLDRKSTRLNSSHLRISYAVFCLENNKYRCK